MHYNKAALWEDPLCERQDPVAALEGDTSTTHLLLVSPAPVIELPGDSPHEFANTKMMGCWIRILCVFDVRLDRSLVLGFSFFPSGMGASSLSGLGRD